jgi:hypothetical protein
MWRSYPAWVNFSAVPVIINSLGPMISTGCLGAMKPATGIGCLAPQGGQLQTRPFAHPAQLN